VIERLTKRGRRKCVWVNGVATSHGRHIGRDLTELAERGLWGGLKTAVPSAIRMDRTVTVLSVRLPSPPADAGAAKPMPVAASAVPRTTNLAFIAELPIASIAAQQTIGV
jgi:hypothetical protein